MERSQRKIHQKDELTWPAHILTCSPLVLSHVIARYQFTGRGMPLQKSSWVAILVSLQQCGFFCLQPCIGKPTLVSYRSKLGLRSTSSNTTKWNKQEQTDHLYIVDKTIFRAGNHEVLVYKILYII